MNHRDDTHTTDRADRALPVTAEVGSEGGSYADSTAQVATFLGDVSRHDGAGGRGSAATSGTHREAVASGGAQESPTSGMLRYPTEPPVPPSASEGRRPGTEHWRTGLIGAAAGAALAFGLARLLSRTR